MSVPINQLPVVTSTGATDVTVVQPIGAQTHSIAVPDLVSQFLPHRWMGFHGHSTVIAGTPLSWFYDTNCQYASRWRQDAPALNDAFTNNFCVAAGTYTFYCHYTQQTVAGIASVYVDNVLKGTIDMYGGASFNTLGTVALGALTAGPHTLKIVAASKNGSSSNYYLEITDLWIKQASD